MHASSADAPAPPARPVASAGAPLGHRTQLGRRWGAAATATHVDPGTHGADGSGDPPVGLDPKGLDPWAPATNDPMGSGHAMVVGGQTARPPRTPRLPATPWFSRSLWAPAAQWVLRTPLCSGDPMGPRDRNFGDLMGSGNPMGSGAPKRRQSPAEAVSAQGAKA